MDFKDLLLIEPLQRAVKEEGYTAPTPIQEQTIPALLEGKDLLGCAQTGTGKTAAFVLPILQKLHLGRKITRNPRALILAPTRELAAQIGQSIRVYGKYVRISSAVIFGGVSQNPQVFALHRGAEIVVATPGRLLDLMNQGHVRLQDIEFFVLDEADRMLDMGFIDDIKKIIQRLPKKRQSLFFSATLEPKVVAFARTLVHDPVHVTINPEKPTVDLIQQFVYFVQKEKKDALLVQLLSRPEMKRVIIFAQMKHIANKVAEMLNHSGIRAEAIHGNKSQGARTVSLDRFRKGSVRVLVATDIAARGIDVEGISHVINYELPMEPETYVHRIGRTARAGAEGQAISFCSAHERHSLIAIERMIHQQIPIVLDHPFHSDAAMHATSAPPSRHRFGRGRRGGGRGRGMGGRRGGGGNRGGGRRR